MGAPVTAANFSITGWGAGASISAVSGDQIRCRLTVTAGTAPSISPSVALTFPVPFFPNPPISMAWVTGGSGQYADMANVATNTNIIFIYTDLPAAGKTYILMLDTLGV